ncbi:MAG: hypothetical protein JNM85_00545 [Chthonomonas sp.]|nr:hypothetical protein [Chthonomonas sp.]
MVEKRLPELDSREIANGWSSHSGWTEAEWQTAASGLVAESNGIGGSIHTVLEGEPAIKK